MNPTLKTRLKNFTQNPATQKALLSLKPEKSVWGILGVILFFIVPEIIGFVWGSDITLFARKSLIMASSAIERQYYEMLIMLFEEGGSWFNLSLGCVLLVWLFF